MPSESVSLKEHFTALLAEKDKALSAALASAKEATSVAEANSEKWRANANEWRSAMDDREKKFVTVSEYKPFAERVETELNDIKLLLQNNLGRKQGISEGWGWLVGCVGLVFMVITILDKLVGK